MQRNIVGESIRKEKWSRDFRENRKDRQIEWGTVGRDKQRFIFDQRKTLLTQKEYKIGEKK